MKRKDRKRRRRRVAVGAGLLAWVAARATPTLRRYMRVGRRAGPDPEDVAPTASLPGKGEEQF